MVKKTSVSFKTDISNLNFIDEISDMEHHMTTVTLHCSVHKYLE